MYALENRETGSICHLSLLLQESSEAFPTLTEQEVHLRAFYRTDARAPSETTKWTCNPRWGQYASDDLNMQPLSEAENTQ